MSLSHLTGFADTDASIYHKRHAASRNVARTLESRLTGTAVALLFSSSLLVGLAVSSNDLQASTEHAKTRIWESVSQVVCGKHVDFLSLVGPSCGRPAP